ncbi:MAG TPA: HAMP domain-containing sensor histidine kinase [Streptosporangiaceae bacterium]|nr:HAMP domain-containing sensor histidine kinase [Streptosporangiaceae bacterium]
MPNRGQRPVGLRLALAFVAVAVLAVAIVAILAVLFTDKDIAVLVQQRRNDLIKSLVADAVSTYNTGKPGWDDVYLSPALDLAASDGAQAAVLDGRGRVVASTLAPAGGTTGLARRPLTLGGRRIGTLLVRFTGQGLVSSANNLRASLVRAVIGAAGLAAVLALVVALAVSRRITRPVIRLIESARAMGRGDRRARVGEVPDAPAELRELAVTFDQMADTLAAQEQLRRDLVADVAHELRTPVAVLQANTEALLDGVLAHTPEQTASLHEEVLRLGRMVEDLQTLAAAEAAALQLSLQPCDLAQVAAAAAEDWEASFAAAGISFQRELELAPVLADPGRLHQVIANLLSNALKFTPPGGQVQLVLSRAGGQARLEVSDTGPGISPADQPRVFDRLWRGAQDAQVIGSGIGLAVAAELTRAHRGTIELTSEPGSGSRFTLTLPLAPSAVG